ncbi:MAG: NTP transferase domain-containing protein, partial [Pseudomonadota bacterium]
MAINLILLAAGEGTRMQSAMPKVLHQIASAPMIVHALAATRDLDRDRTVLVLGSGADDILDAVEGYDAVAVEQTERLGTAHAVLAAKDTLGTVGGDAIVLYGDTPFIRPQTLQAMAEERAKGADVIVLGFEAADPARYGRLVMDGDALERIVEYKDASEAERAITLCNSGVVMAATDTLMNLCGRVRNENASGEYYLTDIVALARA